MCRVERWGIEWRQREMDGTYKGVGVRWWL